MATIAALFDFEEGHYFTSFKLASDLQKRGHRFCYLGPASAEPLARRQGLELIPVFAELLGGVSRSSQAQARTADPAWFGQLLRGAALDPVLRDLKPDLMLMLSLYYPEALAVQLRYRLPVVLWAPFCRSSERTRAELVEDWITSRLMSLKSSDLEATLRAVAAGGSRIGSFKDLAKLVLKMPELVVFPRDIELPEVAEDPGLFYVGTGIDPARRDEPFPWHLVDADRYLVYCSLGSQAELEPETAMRFFRAVLGAAAIHEEWQFILTVGRGFDPALFTPAPPNLCLRQWVPQLEVLRRADLMVTHGGAGTVKECILAGVPMVVLPLMRDQFEMARRVAHHRLGVTGKLAEVTAASLGAAIAAAAADTAMKERVAAMQDRFLEADSSNLGVEVIEAVLAGTPVERLARESGGEEPAPPRPAAGQSRETGERKGMKEVYLKPNVLAEPLVCNWYAWAHLIQPVTAGRNIVDRHLTIMKSFVQAPQVHLAATRNPAMLGGPFISYGPERVKDIKALMDRTLVDQASLITLARAVKELDDLLRSEAKGFSLEPLYSRVPEPLRGFVELVYDLNHNPSFRLIEALLYESPYYDTAQQSFALSLIEGDKDRPFVLSTPRLPEPGLMFVHRPFHHEGYDELFRMKQRPRPYGYIKELLGIGAEDEELFSSFFTEEAPAPYAHYEGAGMRTRYFGHACILIEAKGVSILSDPVLSYEYHADLPRYTYADLPDRIDYVVITHNHQDHVLLETLFQLRYKIGTIVVPRSGGGGLQDPSLKLILKRIGFKSVIEIDEMETIEIEGGTLTGVPFMGEHSDLDIRTKMTYLVRLGAGSALLAADSCNIEPRIYEHVQRIVGDVDILFLGMECDGAPLSWLYGPLVTRPLDRKMDHSRRLSGSNYERGIDIVNRFRCKEAYVYAMGMEPWLKYIMAKDYTPDSDPIIASNRLIADCRERGLVAERLYGEKEIVLAS